MDKTDPPRTFGVFKPVGHTIVAFTNAADLANAHSRLQHQGVPAHHMTRYLPQEMLAQAETDLAQASAMAAIGQERNLVIAHRDLARNGRHFLVVETEDDDRAHAVADIARACGAVLAQQYGRFTIEDLIDPADGKGQVFESPDRGLDTKVADDSVHR